MYFITGCLGITLSYHRQLTHRSFNTPKWLERVFAYCGVMAVQGDPLEWVSGRITGCAVDVIPVRWW
jgi:stearoyl-CoA desaturase (delta-9 desaturase)